MPCNIKMLMHTTKDIPMCKLSVRCGWILTHYGSDTDLCNLWSIIFMCPTQWQITELVWFYRLFRLAWVFCLSLDPSGPKFVFVWTKQFSKKVHLLWSKNDTPIHTHTRTGKNVATNDSKSTASQGVGWASPLRQTHKK